MEAAEVCIAGGGPAGLAAAIALRKLGFSVALFDPALPPIDKACGEGLLPDGMRALSELGIEIPAGAGFAFRGIRFIDHGSSFAADFPFLPALGLRRTVLHEVLMRAATRAGAALHWGVKPIALAGNELTVAGKVVSSKLVVIADGLNSALRRASGLHQPLKEHIRYGFRRHYAVAPWSPYMELHWGRRSQIYITPVSAGQIGVAILSRDPKLRLDEGLEEFFELRRRFEGAGLCSADRGSLTISRKFQRVARPGLALIGDASGSVDAITGDGLSLAFRQALALAEAFRSGDLGRYERAHRRLLCRPERTGRLLLALESRPRLRGRIFKGFARDPEIFARLLAIHAGEAPRFAVLRGPNIL